MAEETLTRDADDSSRSSEGRSGDAGGERASDQHRPAAGAIPEPRRAGADGDGRGGSSDGKGNNPGPDADAAQDGRDESVMERADRRWSELLQELRVAQTGVQILFGFLLAVVFQPRFADLSDLDRNIYLVTVLLGAATTGALIGPVAFHRLVAGQRLKPQAVHWAARLTVLGLCLLLCTMVSALLLIMRVALHNTLAVWLVVGVFVWFVLCWFVLPIWARATHNAGDDTEEGLGSGSGDRKA